MLHVTHSCTEFHLCSGNIFSSSDFLKLNNVSIRAVDGPEFFGPARPVEQIRILGPARPCPFEFQAGPVEQVPLRRFH